MQGLQGPLLAGGFWSKRLGDKRLRPLQEGRVGAALPGFPSSEDAAAGSGCEEKVLSVCFLYLFRVARKLLSQELPPWLSAL